MIQVIHLWSWEVGYTCIIRFKSGNQWAWSCWLWHPLQEPQCKNQRADLLLYCWRQPSTCFPKKAFLKSILNLQNHMWIISVFIKGRGCICVTFLNVKLKYFTVIWLLLLTIFRISILHDVSHLIVASSSFEALEHVHKQIWQ